MADRGAEYRGWRKTPEAECCRWSQGSNTTFRGSPLVPASTRLAPLPEGITFSKVRHQLGTRMQNKSLPQAFSIHI